jgi:hypothetical protein
MSDKDDALISNQAGHFARSRWAQVLALADQLRHNTAVQKTELLRQHALGARSSNFNLDNLTEKYLELKQTLDHMMHLNKNDVQRVMLATSITKSALLIILRSIESLLEVMLKGTRKFPTLYSIISYVRSRENEFPIHGRLLVEWYNAADALDLLINDPDWLVQPTKAQWAMQVCNETLTWTRGIFNENYRPRSARRAIFDRDDSIIIPE